MPAVSIIICAYNRADLLKDAIDSALAQTYKDYELIIVDDGSEDHTRDIVQSYDDRIRYFFQEHKGISSSRNKGIIEARGEYIAFLDSDDVWFPEKLEKQVDAARKTGAGLVHTSRYETDLLGRKPRLVLPLKPARNSNDFLGGETQISMTVLVRREALIKAGMFDENLPSTNDTDMWFRVAKNEEICFIDKPLMDIRIHANNISRNMELKYASRITLSEKILKDPDTRILKPVWRRKLAANYYLLGIEKYERGLYQKCARLIFKALKINIFAGWFITYPGDTFPLKLKILLSPYSLLVKIYLRTRGRS